MSKLPNSWQTVSLGQICNVEMGQSPESSTYNVEGKGLPFFQGKAEFGRFHPSVRKWCTDPKKVAEQGDILLSIRAPVGPSNIAFEKCIIGRGLAALHAIEPVYQKYIFHFIRKLEPWLGQQGTGTTFKAISGEFTRSIEVPLAPQNEQKRIADKLDAVLARVDACRDRLNRIPAILKCFRQSVLAAATSGALTIEWREKKGYAREDWVTTSLGSLVITSANGLSKRRGDKGIETTVLRLADFRNSERVHGNERTIQLDEKEIDKYKLIKNDLLVVRVNGSADLAGKFIKYEQRSTNVEAYCDHFIRLRLDLTQIIPEYALFTANSGVGRSYLESVLVTSAGQNTINQTSLFGLNILLPSMVEQTEIVRRVESLFAYADRLEARYNAARAQVEKLTPSLFAKAFRGELVPQDSNDEPAVELLKRISKENKANLLIKSQATKQKPKAYLPKSVGSLTKDKISAMKNLPTIKLEDITSNYLANILKENVKQDAKSLWMLSRLSIDDFYVQLNHEINAGLVRVNDQDESLLEFVVHQDKE
jgi:type I restriction enzyme, S subunit